MNENELETCSNSSAPSGEEDHQWSAGAQTTRKPISPAKLAANRRNGQKSKGPKSEEGKSSSRWALEEILVEKIAMAYWRLHIAYGYEAEFARSRGEFLVVADRMGRYANTIHRQLLAAMNELERLQRRRLGEAVPAPIAVDVNVNDEKGEFTDELPGPQARSLSLGALSDPVSKRLIGSGTPDASGTVLLSNDEATPFCETNPKLENSREPDAS